MNWEETFQEFIKTISCRWNKKPKEKKIYKNKNWVVLSSLRKEKARERERLLFVHEFSCSKYSQNTERERANKKNIRPTSLVFPSQNPNFASTNPNCIVILYSNRSPSCLSNSLFFFSSSKFVVGFSSPSLPLFRFERFHPNNLGLVFAPIVLCWD